VDEKALERTQPILPLKPGLAERQSHDYRRHGTTTLFAALEVATGRVTDACYDRHRGEEFLKFLKLLPAPPAPRRRRQLLRPQARQRQQVAGEEQAGAPALHPAARVVDEPDLCLPALSAGALQERVSSTAGCLRERILDLRRAAMELAVVRTGTSHRLDGVGPVTDVANDFLTHLETRGFAPGTVRGYAYDLLNFSRFLDERRATLADGGYGV
jgi:hypothetical protein